MGRNACFCVRAPKLGTGCHSQGCEAGARPQTNINFNQRLYPLNHIAYCVHHHLVLYSHPLLPLIPKFRALLSCILRLSIAATISQARLSQNLPYTRMSIMTWAEQIRNARNTAEQVAILRALKNELIGHPMKKEAVVRHGVLDPIVRLSFNTQSGRNDGKSHDHTFAVRPRNEEETVRLQALHVISSVALG